jgi:hypothetical protein
MFCIANCIIIDYNNDLLKGNNIISKPNSESIYLLKINQLKKIAHEELKILKSKRDRIEKSMKRLSLINKDDIYLSDNDFNLNNNNFLNNNISIIISFSALFFGFIFAIVFLIMAYLFSE